MSDTQSASPWRPASDPPKKTEWVLVAADGSVRCAAWNNNHGCFEDWDEIGGIDMDDIEWWMPIPDLPA
jgi:hypothetical protein